MAAAAPATGQPGQPMQQAALTKSDRVVAGSPVAQGQIQAAQDRMGGPVVTAPNQGTVAIAAATGAAAPANPSPAAAYAASDEPVIPSVVAIPMPNPARPGDSALLPVSASTAQATIPMTSDVVAIQSVVPTPRPGGDAPVMAPAEVAYAAPEQIGLRRYADNRAHYDFNFDTSGPTVVSAAPIVPNYDSDVPPAEKGYVSKLIQKYAKLYEIPESLIHRDARRDGSAIPGFRKAWRISG
ncbi:MAG: lytic transglycosylase domain-containing protein [Rhizobium sp.]